MTFKDELNKKVESFRGDLKRKALLFFSQILKSEMIEVAEEGRKNGSIDLESIEFSDEFNRVDLLKLQKMLIYVDEIESEEEVFSWLLKEVRKIKDFDDINIIILDDNFLEFNWHD
jgi:hypothetical protein